jgi:hypothetical protein
VPANGRAVLKVHASDAGGAEGPYTVTVGETAGGS